MQPPATSDEKIGEKMETLQQWTGIMGCIPVKQPVIGEAPTQQGLRVWVGLNGHGKGFSAQKSVEKVKTDRHGSRISIRRGVGTAFSREGERSIRML